MQNIKRKLYELFITMLTFIVSKTFYYILNAFFSLSPLYILKTLQIRKYRF